MAVTVAELVARLVADVSQFKNGLAEADGAISRSKGSLESLGQSASAVGRRLTLGVSLPLAAAGVAAFKELESAGKAAAQTNAVIKSTGGVANVTTKEVQNLANAIMEKSGIDDEAIVSGENLLLTFKNIRDEAGKGNDIFTQATKLAADLSIAWGQDMKSSAIQLGKALNDPVRGMTALQRVGITFSKSQRETIAQLVETGRVLEAQKLILKEVKSQVGGSADAYGKTLAGQVSRAREELLNAGASIVASAAPALKFLADAAREAAGFIQSLPGPVRDLVGAFGGIALIAGPALMFFGAIARNVAALKAASTGMSSLAGGIGNLGSKLGIMGGIATALVGIAVGIERVVNGGFAFDISAQTVAAGTMKQIGAMALLNYENGKLADTVRNLALTNTDMATRLIDAAAKAGVAGGDIDRYRAIVDNAVAANKRLSGTPANVTVTTSGFPEAMAALDELLAKVNRGYNVNVTAGFGAGWDQVALSGGLR